MRKVKGTMVITIIKSIKANKTKKNEYNNILSEEAKEFLNQRILSSSWYPFEVYKECFDALCLVEGKNNPTMLTKWGQDEAEPWLKTIYAATIVKGDPQTAAEKFARFHKIVFNFGKIVPEFISDTEIHFSYKDFIPEWENFYHLAAGWVQKFIELSIDKKVDFHYLTKSWKGEGETKIRISWFS
ncbi:MAG: hypothetical protein ACFE9Z_10355 [Promethearchaeota archaeon]